MCSFRSCQTRFEFLSQFRKVLNAFECFITQVQTRLPKTKCVWPMKINVICTVCVWHCDNRMVMETCNALIACHGHISVYDICTDAIIIIKLYNPRQVHIFRWTYIPLRLISHGKYTIKLECRKKICWKCTYLPPCQSLNNIYQISTDLYTMFLVSWNRIIQDKEPDPFWASPGSPSCRQTATGIHLRASEPVILYKTE